MTKTQSTLPEYMEQKTIANMKVGDTAYTYPFVLSVTDDRSLWINRDFDVFPASEGSYTMFIQRTKSGFNVKESTIGTEKFEVNEALHIKRTGPAPFPLPVSLVKEIKLEGDNDAH